MKGYTHVLAITLSERAKQGEMWANDNFMKKKYEAAQVEGFANKFLIIEDIDSAEFLAREMAEMCGKSLPVDINQSLDNLAETDPSVETLGVYIAVHCNERAETSIDMRLVGEAIAYLAVFGRLQIGKICVDGCYTATTVLAHVDAPEDTAALRVGYGAQAILTKVNKQDLLVDCRLAGYREVVVKYDSEDPSLGKDFGNFTNVPNGMQTTWQGRSIGTHPSTGKPIPTYYPIKQKPSVKLEDAYHPDNNRADMSRKKKFPAKDQWIPIHLIHSKSVLYKYVETLNRYMAIKKAWKFTPFYTWIEVALSEYTNKDDLFTDFKIERDSIGNKFTITAVRNPNFKG